MKGHKVKQKMPKMRDGKSGTGIHGKGDTTTKKKVEKGYYYDAGAARR